MVLPLADTLPEGGISSLDFRSSLTCSCVTKINKENVFFALDILIVLVKVFTLVAQSTLKSTLRAKRERKVAKLFD